VRPAYVAPLLVDMGAMGLGPVLTGPDAPLQGPCGVREVQGKRSQDGLYRDAADHGACGEHCQRGPQPVAADITEEDPCPDRIPRQEGERAGRDRGATGGQEHIRPPQTEAPKGSAADQRMSGGNAVHPVHEVEHVHEGGYPERDEDRSGRLPGRRQAEAAHQHGGGGEARHALQHQPAADRQPGQVVGESDHAEPRDRDREGRGRRAADKQRGQHKPHGDRRPSAARRWHGM